MKKGFTILELLVVISVLVILIGIAIPRFKGMQDAGRLAQAKAELHTVQTAVESYYTNNSNNYPASNTALVGSSLISQTPQILGVAPYDPFGATTTTEYKYVTNQGYYVIASTGPTSPTALASLAITTSGTVSGVGSGGLCVTNGTGC